MRGNREAKGEGPVTESPSFTCTGHPSLCLILLLNSFVEAKQAAEQPPRPLPHTHTHTRLGKKNVLKMYQTTIPPQPRSSCFPSFFLKINRKKNVWFVVVLPLPSSSAAFRLLLSIDFFCFILFLDLFRVQSASTGGRCCCANR